ncbi:MAG: VIT domain-containing protein [Candidatus Eisenbacteria bacterium]|nr:VIT domain-containing protein [Candidatus Eisenbacteria bacterium]
MPIQQQLNDSADLASGVMTTRDGARVPLLAVEIDVSVHDTVSNLTLRQFYRNGERVPIEALYSFPVGDLSAMHRLEVRIGDRLIRAAIDEKDLALAAYDDALAAGNRAILLDQDRPNILTLSLGNLLPGEEAVVTIGTASELERHGDSLRLLIPTTISPRYVPAEQAATLDPSELSDICPPLRNAVPYGLRLRVAIRGNSPVREVECVSHPVRTEFAGGGAVVTLCDRQTTLDQDVVLNIRFEAAPESSALVVRDGETECIAGVEFRPAFDAFPRQPCEIVFLIDRSGSMEGESIEQARRTLQICLRSLIEGDCFNIIGFGSTFESLFGTSVPYSQKSLEAATGHVSEIHADLGGTEMLAPLQFILGHKSFARRRVVLVTDGQVSNEDEVATLVASHPETAVFTFGIGRGVNEHLARIIARSGGGGAEFVFPGERIEQKVMRQFGRITGPTFTDVRLTWEGATPDLVTPGRLPPLSEDAVVRLYARLARNRHVRVTLHAVGPNGPLSWTQEFDTGDPIDEEALPALLARAAIREIEEEQVAQTDRSRSRRVARQDRLAVARIVALSRRYGVLSSETSFIGVEVIPDANPDIQPEFRHIPVALTRGWGSPTDGMLFERNYTSASPARSPLVGRAGLTLCDVESAHRSRPWADKVRPDPETQLLLLQLADGSWKLDSAFLTAVSLKKKALQPLLKQLAVDKDLGGRIVATLVALRHLLRDPDREAEWQFLVQKARLWLGALPARPPGSSDWEAWLDRELPMA